MISPMRSARGMVIQLAATTLMAASPSSAAPVSSKIRAKLRRRTE